LFGIDPAFGFLGQLIPLGLSPTFGDLDLDLSPTGDLFLGSLAAFAGAPDAAGTGIPHATRLDPTTTFLWGSAFWYSLSPFANLLQSFGNRKMSVRVSVLHPVTCAVTH